MIDKRIGLWTTSRVAYLDGIHLPIDQVGMAFSDRWTQGRRPSDGIIPYGPRRHDIGLLQFHIMAQGQQRFGIRADSRSQIKVTGDSVDRLLDYDIHDRPAAQSPYITEYGGLIHWPSPGVGEDSGGAKGQYERGSVLFSRTTHIFMVKPDTFAGKGADGEGFGNHRSFIQHLDRNRTTVRAHGIGHISAGKCGKGRQLSIDQHHQLGHVQCPAQLDLPAHGMFRRRTSP